MNHQQTEQSRHHEWRQLGGANLPRRLHRWRNEADKRGIETIKRDHEKAQNQNALEKVGIGVSVDKLLYVDWLVPIPIL